MVWKKAGRTALTVVVATVGIGATAGTAHAAAGHVYTMTNAEAGNAVVVFNRDSKGRLYQGGVYETGGKGLGGNQTFPVPIADSDGPLRLTRDGKVLFATNIGSNSVTSFRVRKNTLIRVQTVDSGGVRPNAVDAAKGFMYVTNAESATMTGYRYTSSGRMTPIAGSTTTLAADSLPAAVRIDPEHQYLAVTERGTNQTARYPLDASGVPGAPVNYPVAAGSAHPFALFLTSNDVMLTGDEGNPPPTGPGGDSRLNSFNAADTSNTNPIDTQPNGETATCWIEMTGNERYGFATSALSGNVTTFSLGTDGKITVTGAQHVPDFVASDIGRSSDSRFVYVVSIDVDPMALAFKSARIVIYSVGSTGLLTKVGQTPASLLGSTAGLQAR